MKNTYQNKKGVALITVVMFFLVMVILLSGLLFSTVSNLGNTQTAQKHTSVFYAAESGINLQVAKFINLIEEAKAETWAKTSLDYEISLLVNQINNVDNTVILKDNLGNPVETTISITGPHYDVNFEDYTFYTIQSIGEIENVNRTLTTNFGYRYVIGEGPLLPISGAIIANAGINVGQGAIVGPIASNFVNGSTITIGNGNSAFDCEDVGDLGIPEDRDDITLCPDQTEPLDHLIHFGPVRTPDYNALYPLNNLQQVSRSGNTLNLTSAPTGGVGFKVTDLNITSDFSINLGSWAASDDQVIVLRVQKSALPNGIVFGDDSNDDITVIGKGKLMILVEHTDSMAISGNINNVSNPNPNKFMIVLRTKNPTLEQSRELNIDSNGGKTTVIASILSDSIANISWNKVNFFGFLITNAGFNAGTNVTQDYDGNVVFTAGSEVGVVGYPPIWIYAPYARINLQAAGSIVYGTLKGNSVDVQANKGGIIYPESNLEYPFSEWTQLPVYDNGDPVNADIEYRVSPIKEN